MYVIFMTNMARLTSYAGPSMVLLGNGEFREFNQQTSIKVRLTWIELVTVDQGAECLILDL